jgi:hypothetical protein
VLLHVLGFPFPGSHRLLAVLDSGFKQLEPRLPVRECAVALMLCLAHGSTALDIAPLKKKRRSVSGANIRLTQHA